MIPAQVQQLSFIVIALVAATALSFILTPLAVRFAHFTGAIDEPDSGRRIHALPIPRAGGLAIAISFVIVGTAAAWLNGMFQIVPAGALGLPTFVVLFVGVSLAAILGFIDDRWQIRARWQALSQLFLAAITIAAGVTITFVYNPFQFLGGDFRGDRIFFAEWPIAALVTTIWIVGMINSLNFIDGLDGLSSGVALIAALTLGVISIAQGQVMVGLLCAVLGGALAGFLPWNFHPAKVFTGTTGVMAVGFALAVLSILGVAKVAVALLVLGVPIIDTFWIIIRRVSQRKSPFTPDRGHFHHRLLDLGLTHRSAVMVIYGICIALAVLSLVLSGSGPLYAFMGIVVGGGLMLFLLTRHSSDDALDARSYPDDETGTSDQGSEGPITGRAIAEVQIEEARRRGTRPAG